MRSRSDTNPIPVPRWRNIQQSPLAVRQEPVGTHDREHAPTVVHAGRDRRHPPQRLIPPQTIRQPHQKLGRNSFTTEQHLSGDALTRWHRPKALQQRPFRSRYPSGTLPRNSTHQQSVLLLCEHPHPQPSGGSRLHRRARNAQRTPHIDSNRCHRHSSAMANPMRHRTIQRLQPLMVRNGKSRVENVDTTSRPGQSRINRACLHSLPAPPWPSRGSIRKLTIFPADSHHNPAVPTLGRRHPATRSLLPSPTAPPQDLGCARIPRATPAPGLPSTLLTTTNKPTHPNKPPTGPMNRITLVFWRVRCTRGGSEPPRVTTRC